MARQRIRKRPMSEINVVPYIDVMLVLLVIFMVTAPLLTQGVKVELPQASASPIDKKEQEPVVVTVDVDGNFINVDSDDPDIFLKVDGHWTPRGNQIIADELYLRLNQILQE